MEHLEKAIQLMDWKLLRKQKLNLLNILSSTTVNTTKTQHEALEGILNLIDAVQDAAVADKIATKKQVFGTYKG